MIFFEFVDFEDDIGYIINEDSECLAFEGDSEVEFSVGRVFCLFCSNIYKVKKYMKVYCRNKYRDEIFVLN